MGKKQKRDSKNSRAPLAVLTGQQKVFALDGIAATTKSCVAERETTQWYFQRYVAELPARAEIVLFDRSWYNRAGVEHVMGFCSDAEYIEFLQSCPRFEMYAVAQGRKLRRQKRETCRRSACEHTLR